MTKHNMESHPLVVEFDNVPLLLCVGLLRNTLVIDLQTLYNDLRCMCCLKLVYGHDGLPLCTIIVGGDDLHMLSFHEEA